MNTWLYRAAGTVGIAGGFLLLAAGGAQADHGEGAGVPDGLLGDALSPTAGLPPLDLTTAGARPDISALRLDPADGRHGPPITGAPELLPDLPPGIGGLPALPDLGQLLDGVPLDAPGLPGGRGDARLPMDRLAAIDGRLARLPLDTDPRTLPAPADLPSLLPAGTPADPAVHTGGPAIDSGGPAIDSGGPAIDAPPAEVIGPLAGATSPLPDLPLPLGGLTDIAGQVPLGLLEQAVDGLPVSPDMLGAVDGLPVSPDALAATGGQQPAAPAAERIAGDPLAAPGEALGDPLPALIADQVAFEGLYQDGLFADSRAELAGELPLIGPALAPVGQMVVIGNLPSQLPLAGDVLGPALSDLPMIEGPSGDPAPNPAGVGMPAGERPIAGEDPEFG